MTRLVGLGVLIEQILIIAYTNWYKWPPTLLNADGTYKGGYEYNVALGLLGLLLFVMGAGAVSIDRLFRRKKPPFEEEDDAFAPQSTTRAARDLPTETTDGFTGKPQLAHRALVRSGVRLGRMIRTDGTTHPSPDPTARPSGFSRSTTNPA